jgi:hypothetical protein
MKLRQYIVGVGNSSPLNYDCYRIFAKNKEQAIFKAALKCGRQDWKLLSVEHAKNYVPYAGDCLNCGKPLPELIMGMKVCSSCMSKD